MLENVTLNSQSSYKQYNYIKDKKTLATERTRHKKSTQYKDQSETVKCQFKNDRVIKIKALQNYKTLNIE